MLTRTLWTVWTPLFPFPGQPPRTTCFARTDDELLVGGPVPLSRHERNRYRQADNPSEPLVVFAIESRGRLGVSALQLLRSMAPQDSTRGSELSRTYRELSVITMRRRAQLPRAAQGGPAGIAERGARSAGRR